MEYNRGYYKDLVVYELKTRPMDFDAWETITRMVNNPSKLTKQEILFDCMTNGHYLIKVTESVMDTMKKVVNFISVQRVDDEARRYHEIMKRYHPYTWA